MSKQTSAAFLSRVSIQPSIYYHSRYLGFNQHVYFSSSNKFRAIVGNGLENKENENGYKIATEAELNNELDEEFKKGSVILWFNNIYPVSYRKRDIRWIFIGKATSGTRLRTMTTSPLLVPPMRMQEKLHEYIEKKANSKSSTSTVSIGNSKIPYNVGSQIEISSIKYIPNWKEGGLFTLINYKYPLKQTNTSPSGMKSESEATPSLDSELSKFISFAVRESLRTRGVRSFFNLQQVLCYPVQGQPWVDDMIGRTPSNKIKVEYEISSNAPIDAIKSPVKLDLRTVYESFRKFGKIIDIQHSPSLPPAIASAKDAPLPYVTVEYVRIRSATSARNCMTGDSGITVPIPPSPSALDPGQAHTIKRADASVTSLEDAFSLTNVDIEDKNKLQKESFDATRESKTELTDERYYRLIRKRATDDNYFNPVNRRVASSSDLPITLRISYEKSGPKFNIWDWINNHQRLSVPILLALVAVVTYSVFDPYRIFSMTNRITGRFDFSDYYNLMTIDNFGGIRKNARNYSGFSQFIYDALAVIGSFLGINSVATIRTRDSDRDYEKNSKPNKISSGIIIEEEPVEKPKTENSTLNNVFGWLNFNIFNAGVEDDSISKKSEKEKSEDDSLIKGWEDRIHEAEKLISRLRQEPDSVILINGPRGSGKSQLINSILPEFDFRLFIDLEHISAATTDTQMLGRLANQVNYFPLFSSFVRMSSMIDIALTATTGAKAGLTTSTDDQLKRVLELLTMSLEKIIRKEHDRVNKDIKKFRQLSEKNKATNTTRQIVHSSVQNEIDNIAQDENYSSPESDKSATIADSPISANLTISSTNDATNDDVESQIKARYPVIIIKGFMPKHMANTSAGMFGLLKNGNNSISGGRADTSRLQEYLIEWATMVTELKIAHVVFMSDNPAAVKSVSLTANKAVELISLHDASKELAEKLLLTKLSAEKRNNGIISDEHAIPGISLDEARKCVSVIGGRLTDLDILVSQVLASPGIKCLDALSEVVSRATAEVRRIGVAGETLDQAKNKGFLWSRIQFWRVIQLITLAPKNEVSYVKIKFDPVFNGNDNPLLALERIGLISIVYKEGSPSTITPGRPMYVAAFKRLIEDEKLSASMGIEICKTSIVSEEAKARLYEEEMILLNQFQWSQDKTVRHETEARLKFLASLLAGTQTNIDRAYKELAKHKKTISS